jgi:hypothetical protein
MAELDDAIERIVEVLRRIDTTESCPPFHPRLVENLPPT